MKKFGVAIISLLLVLSISVPSLVFADYNQKAGKEISILFSHDMHSHLESNNGVGGFAKMATVINEVKRDYPDTFLLDGGDFSMGTPYQAIYKSTASELRMLGFLGYDVTTIGNHEFDHRTKGLSRMLTSAMNSKENLPQIVLANLDWKGTLADKKLVTEGQKLKDAFNRYNVKDYTVVKKGGVKVAVFGIFGKEADSYAPESGVKFLDPIETAKKVVAKIEKNEDADLIVCVSHSGTNQDNPKKSEDELLAKNVDGIDFIVSGHSHTEFDKPLVINDTVIGSAGQYTDNLGQVTFKETADGYKLDKYKLISLDKNVQENVATNEKILEFRDLIDRKYFSHYGYSIDQVIAKSSFDFTDISTFGLEQGEDPLGNLMADAYIYGVKKAEGDNYENVDVAILPAGIVRASFSKGKITVADAFNALSLGVGPNGMAGYPLVSVYLTGKELKTAAEVDISVSEIMQPARLYMSGLTYTYNPNRLILNRVTSVKLDLGSGRTEEIDDKKLYRVIGDLYSCQMLSTVESQSYGLLKVEPKDKEGNPITNFEDHMVLNQRGKEVKEWAALTKYIDSFSYNQVPTYYNQTQGRKIIEDSHNIFDLLKNPNKIFWMALGIILLAIVLIVLIVILIIKLVRRLVGKPSKKKQGQSGKIFSHRKNKYNSRW
ncbi:MAG: bifunctional UDP-sugar hydrolase/5'-nucleotidase [Anaerovoracaceae bacterium]